MYVYHSTAVKQPPVDMAYVDQCLLFNLLVWLHAGLYWPYVTIWHMRSIHDMPNVTVVNDTVTSYNDCNDTTLAV